MKLQVVVFLFALVAIRFGIETCPAENIEGVYLISQLKTAQAVAEKKHVPLVWISTDKEYLEGQYLDQDSAQLSIMALRYLGAQVKSGRIVLLMFFGNDEIGLTPAIVHNQFHQQDDGYQGEGISYLIPKIVFSSGDATTIFGRISHTQMASDREAVIESLLQHVETDRAMQTKLHSPPVITPTTQEVKVQTDRKLWILDAAVVILALVLAWSIYRSLPRIFGARERSNT